MRWLAPLVVLGATGCFVLDCPRGNAYCEGDVLTFCNSRCTGDSKTNRSCSPSITSTDCATVMTGVKKTCRDLSYKGGKTAACLDAALTSCAPFEGGERVAVPMTCLPNGRVVYCATFGSEAFEDTRECERPELVCLLTGTGLGCVDSPKAACDPAQFPRCDNGRYERRCVGAPDAGHFVRTNDCGATRFCKVSDAGLTFCADQP